MPENSNLEVQSSNRSHRPSFLRVSYLRFRALVAITVFGLGFFVRGDERIDDLSQDALQEAFRILQRDYIRQEALSYDQLNKAAFDGLLRRLKFGAQLVDRNPDEEGRQTRVGFHAEELIPKVGYLRLASYKEAELKLLDETLRDYRDKDFETLILDLRAPQPAADLEVAARVLDRFVENNTLLFKIQKPHDKRPTLFFSQVSGARWDGVLVVLVDEETPNTGEIIAAVIDLNRECLMIGSKTKGVTVQYEQIALNESTFLRFAVSEVVLGDDSSLFQKGIEPDFHVSSSLESKHKVFLASADGSMDRYIFETPRPRMNEAALVHETDPELDYHLARARGEVTAFDRVPVQDKVLQRAIDLLMTLDHLDKADASGKE